MTPCTFDPCIFATLKPWCMMEYANLAMSLRQGGARELAVFGEKCIRRLLSLLVWLVREGPGILAKARQAVACKTKSRFVGAKRIEADPRILPSFRQVGRSSKIRIILLRTFRCCRTPLPELVSGVKFLLLPASNFNNMQTHVVNSSFHNPTAVRAIPLRLYIIRAVK